MPNWSNKLPAKQLCNDAFVSPSQTFHLHRFIKSRHKACIIIFLGNQLLICVENPRNIFCMWCRDKKGQQSGIGLDRLYSTKSKERQDGLKELNGQLSLWIRRKVGSRGCKASWSISIMPQDWFLWICVGVYEPRNLKIAEVSRRALLRLGNQAKRI